MDSARWEAFFRACGIVREAAKLYAEILHRERIGPDLLSDLSGENLKEVGIEAFGDRLRVLKYVKSTTGSPPEFAQGQENDGHTNHSRQNTPDVLPSYATVSTGRSFSASGDATAQGAGQSAAPLAENCLLPFDCQHVGDTSFAAQLKHEPTEQVGDADANDADQRPAATEDRDHAVAAEVTTLEVDSRGVDKNSENRIEQGAPSDEDNACDDVTGQVEYKELEPLVAILGIPKDEPSIPLNASLTSHELERFLTAMHVPLYNSTEWQPPSSTASTWSDIRSDHVSSSLAKGTQPKGESNTPAKTGKIRLPRSTASASRRLPDPPLETHHEDEFPPPDERNALQQISIDQLRRNGQLRELDHKALLKKQNPYTKTSNPGTSKPGSSSLRSNGRPPSSLPKDQTIGSARRKGAKTISQQATRIKRSSRAHDRVKRKYCICTACGKSYADSTGLNRHKALHANERSYACKQCTSRFNRADALQSHLERVHALEKLLKCDKCHRSFNVERNFLLHKCLICEHCTRLFRCAKSFQKHVKRCTAKQMIPT